MRSADPPSGLDSEKFARFAPRLLKGCAQIGVGQTPKQLQGVEEIALAHPICAYDDLQRGQIQRKILERLKAIEFDSGNHFISHTTV